jgi:hypothetical protein
VGPRADAKQIGCSRANTAVGIDPTTVKLDQKIRQRKSLNAGSQHVAITDNNLGDLARSRRDGMHTLTILRERPRPWKPKNTPKPKS